MFEDKKFAQRLKFVFVYIICTNIVTQLTPETERARASCYVTAPRSHWGTNSKRYNKVYKQTGEERQEVEEKTKVVGV